jgi:CPA2 family monovalent cation:H+ antiporter-2
LHDIHAFLTNLTLVLGVAAVTTVVFQRLRQPVVLGYLLAGAIVSPHTPFPVFADEHTIRLLSELGVILLMFSLGLEFSVAKLLRVLPTAGLVAVFQCGMMIWLGYATAQAFGWTPLESLFAGALIAISSTTIIVKAFEEQHVRGPLTEIVFGVLIVEDLIAILLMAILTTLSTGTDLSASGLAETGGRLTAFLAAVLGLGLLLVPRAMRAVVRLDRSETIIVASVGICFALALLAEAAGYSVALGAFLAGALVAESGEAAKIEHLVQPVRDVFAAIFFVAVGMLIDPALIADHWVAVVAFTVVVIVGKVASVTVGVFLTGRGAPTAIRAGMSLAQIGEFSFIIAGLGLTTRATGSFLYPVAVAVSAITTLVTPWLIRFSGPVASYVDRRLPHRIQTFAALYGTWIESLRSRPREPSAARRMRRLVGLLALDFACVGAIAIAAASWGPAAVRAAGGALGWSEVSRWVAAGVATALAAALALPFCIGIARCAASLAEELATAALPAPAIGPDTADAPRGVLAAVLELGILLLIGIPFLAVAQPFVPRLLAPAAFVLVVVALAATFWRRASNLHAHAQAGALAIVELLSRQMRADGAARQDSAGLEQLHRILPGLGDPVSIQVRGNDGAVGMTLAEIDLRGRTGATVLAIVRHDASTVVPTARERLRAGDVLAVAGTAEAIASARRILAQPASAPEEAVKTDAGGRPTGD